MKIVGTKLTNRSVNKYANMAKVIMLQIKKMFKNKKQQHKQTVFGVMKACKKIKN